MTAHGWMVRNAHSPQLNYSINQNTSFTFDALRSAYGPPSLYTKNSVLVVPRFEVETMAYW